MSDLEELARVVQAKARVPKRHKGSDMVPLISAFAITFVVVGLIVFVGYQVASNWQSTPSPNRSQVQQEVPVRVDARDVMRAYLTNEVEADSQYNGRLVAISGRVRSIGKDILGTPYLTLEGGANFRDIQITFDESTSSQLIGLRPGDSCLVQCRGNGLMGNVLFKEGRILR